MPYVAYKVEFSLLCELLLEKRSLCTPLCAKIKKESLVIFFPLQQLSNFFLHWFHHQRQRRRFFLPHLHPKEAPSLKTIIYFFLTVWWRAKRCTPVSSPVALHVNASYNVSNNSVAVSSSNCDPSSISGSARRWLIGEESECCVRLIRRACATLWTHL